LRVNALQFVAQLAGELRSLDGLRRPWRDLLYWFSAIVTRGMAG
jgi:hypothetical protein